MKTDQAVKELQEMKAFFQTAIKGSEKNIAMRKRQISAIDAALEAVTTGRQEAAEEQPGERDKGKAVKEILLEVSEEICDNYCRFRDTVDGEYQCEVTRNGGTCPLDKLN